MKLKQKNLKKRIMMQPKFLHQSRVVDQFFLSLLDNAMTYDESQSH